MDEKDGPFLSKVEGVVNVSIERLGAWAKIRKKTTAFTWCSEGGQFHRDIFIYMHRTLQKCQNICACGYISITNRTISIKKWPPWLSHMNAKSFCLLLAWAPNLSILTLLSYKGVCMAGLKKCTILDLHSSVNLDHGIPNAIQSITWDCRLVNRNFVKTFVFEICYLLI